MEYEEFKYIKEGDQFIWCEGEERLHISDNLWFFVDTAHLDDHMCTLHSHGSKENIEKRYNDFVGKMRNTGNDDMAADVMMIDVSKLDIEEINKCISITGYVSKFVKAIKEA